MGTKSLYEVLGIPMGASYTEIKTAYRRLARTIHPDVVSMNQKDTSSNEFIKIHTAYSTLSDPRKRADYDRDLYRRKRPFGSKYFFSSTTISYAAMTAASSSSMYSYGGKNWETDQCW